MKQDLVTKEVLEVYLKESPSAIAIEDNMEFLKFQRGQKRLWQSLLKIPIRALKDSTVFDFGCGTGEIDIFMALNGARVKGLDFNPESIGRARRLANHFSVEEKAVFSVSDVHDKNFPEDSADFAISIGVLPHVKDPKKVFGHMVSSCKDGAFVVIGFVEELGIVQRLLHRSIIRAIAGFDEDQIIKIAKQAFPDHINRSVKFGQRTERSVIYDYLVNRHMYGLPLEKVISWFDENHVSYYSSWPCIEMPFQVSPYSSNPFPLAHPLWRDYRALLRLRWLFAQLEDDSVFSWLGGVLGDKKESKNISTVTDELASILSQLVQIQDQPWDESELNKLDLTTQIIKGGILDILNKFLTQINQEIESLFNALLQVIASVAKLQKKEISEYNPISNFFRKLNGLGTLYLVGVVNKSNE